MEHNLREPAREMHITPGIKTASLASTGKYADANYATLYTKDSVEVYDMENTKIFVFTPFWEVKGKLIIANIFAALQSKNWM